MPEQSQELVEMPAATRQALSGVQFERRGQGGGLVLIPTNLDQAALVAQMLSRADVGVPAYLRGNPGACLLVVIQATDWEMNAFSVAKKTYKVNDQIAYEAQLINSVVNTRAPVKGRPRVRYEGAGPELRCTFEYTMADGEVLEYRSPMVKDIPVKNSPLWKSDPEQQLFYYSSRAWARRWVPEVLMGVYTPDEIIVQESEDQDRARSFSELEARAGVGGEAGDAEFEEVPVAAAPPKPRAKKVEEPKTGPQQPASAAAPTSAQAEAATPASGDGAATVAGTPGSGAPTARLLPEGADQFVQPDDGGPKRSLKLSNDGKWGVTVEFAALEALPTTGEVYMIGYVEAADGGWIGHVDRGPGGELMFWTDGVQVEVRMANNHPPVFAYGAHAPRPTETASAPNAEAEQGSSDSATDASTASRADASGTMAEAPRPSPAPGVSPEFAAFLELLAGAEDWPKAIAPALAALRKTEAWAAAPQEYQIRLHSLAYQRLVEMIGNGYRFDFLNDLHAYRCYIDQEWDLDALLGNRRVMDKSALWTSLPLATQKVFDDAFLAQKKRITERAKLGNTVGAATAAGSDEYS